MHQQCSVTQEAEVANSKATLVVPDSVTDEVVDEIVEGVHQYNQRKREPTTEEKQRAAAMHILNELGKRRVKEDELLFEGTRFVLPKQYDGRVEEAIEFLMRWVAQQNKRHTFSRTFKYRPYDTAYAFLEVMKVLTGTQGLGVSTFDMFGNENPPEFVSINIDVNKTTQIPWGHIEFPMFKAEFEISYSKHEDFGLVGQLQVTAPKRQQAAMEAIFEMVEEYLNANSLYRGKAVNGHGMNPEFIDLSAVDPEKVVYSEEVLNDLDANIWAPIRYTEQFRNQGISIKRAVLFAGPYGTGKTLGCMLTAQQAVNNGWTFIQCRTGVDKPDEVMKMAALYQPAVVVVEDFDANSGTTTDVEISRLLEMLDGATRKGAEVVGLFTTNHPDKIQKGALRPGRIDAVIEIGGLDEAGFRKLIGITIGLDWLDKSVDWAKVAEAFDGFLPAFVKEAAERAQRYAMARNHGKPTKITTNDLLGAARGLRPQLDRMMGAKEGARPLTVNDLIRDEVEGVVTRTSLPGYGDFAVQPATLHNGGKKA